MVESERAPKPAVKLTEKQAKEQLAVAFPSVVDSLRRQLGATCDDPLDPEHFAIEAFDIVLRALQEGRVQSLRQYWVAVSISVYYREYKRRKREEAWDFTTAWPLTHQDANLTTMETVTESLLEHDIEAALAGDEMAMNVLRLRLEGLSVKDIENETGLTTSQIRTLLLNIKEAIRKKWRWPKPPPS